MGRERLVARTMFAAAAVTAAVTCGNGAGKPPDGGSDAGPPDGPTLPSLEVAVTGCATYDTDAPGCAVNGETANACGGPPPLALSFAPVGSQQLTQFKWTFGDGTPPVTDPAPLHTFALPGCYEVKLVGQGDMGTVQPLHPLTVRVTAQPIGAPCDVDAQCARGFECACAPGKGCAPAFSHGLCSVACDSDPCDRGEVCAALAFASSADAGAAARSANCIAACASDTDCAPGFSCPTLRASGVPASTAWVRGCLPIGAQRDLGAPCRDENEVLAPDSCGTGVCADLGALGVCSTSCDASRPCPSGSACASLSDGRYLCLAPCGSAADCARDPLFACVAGLTDGGDADVSVCAPRSCATDDECAPSGHCGANAVCVRR